MRLLYLLWKFAFFGESRWRFEEAPVNDSPGIIRFKMGYRRRAAAPILLIILGSVSVALWGIMPGGFLLILGLFAAWWYSLDRKEIELDTHARTITYFIREANFKSVLKYPYGRLRSLTLEYPSGELQAVLRIEPDDGMQMILGRGAPASLLNLAHRISEVTGIPIMQSVMRRPEGPAVPTPIQILAAEQCSSQGVCPICMTRLEGALHRCERCNSVHHQECWNYFGGCAIYACIRQGAFQPST
jgi:hypothetical protein